MGKIILTALISVIWGLSYAQVINVVSTFPENGDVAVTGDSIKIEFDQPILFDTEFPEDEGFVYFIEPDPDFNFSEITISEDNRTVTFFGTFTENTDYAFGVFAVEGEVGGSLAQPLLIRFTTADEWGEFTIVGELTKPHETSPVFENHMVFVTPSIDFFGDESQPVYSTLVNPSTGAFSIPWIREGSFTAFGVDLNQIDLESEQIFSGFYFLDENEDFSPDTFLVNASTATENTFGPISLIPLDFSPFDYHESLTRTISFRSSISSDFVFMGAETFFGVFDEAIQSEKKRNISPFISLSSTRKKGVANAEGKTFFWQHFYYNSSTDKLYLAEVSPFGTFLIDSLTAEDAEIPVDLSTIKPAPENAVNSDVVVSTFLSNGGQTFLDGTTEASFVDYSIQLLHEYWNLSSNPTPEAPVFWKAAAYAYYFDFQTSESSVDSIVVFLDAESGEIIQSDVSTSSEEEILPFEFSLGQNYPNPFNPTTNIPFSLSKASNVEIAIYNVVGQRVAVLANSQFSAGEHTVQWDATNNASGIYLYQLRSDGFNQTRKLLLIK